MAFKLLFALLLAGSHLVASQNSTVPSSTIAAASQTSSGSISFVTSVELSVDDLWDLYVGPVSTFSINTTVEPTPIPSSSLIPPPTLYYPPLPTGQQVPLQSRNESWKFPKDFWYGVAGAAYQIEGAVKAEGRGPSVWDVLTHRVTNYVRTNDTGDIADNNYYQYKEDIARIAAIGIKTYSFSLSWSRILPFGSGPVNEQALRHYDDLIDTCLQYGVTPMVTLYHWDTPLFLQNLYGGWLSPRIIPDFTEYARVVFTRWHSKVHYWFTVNEPIVFCNFYPLPTNYFKNTSIPKKQQPYFCGHHVLLSHAAAYHLGKGINSSLSISFKTNGGYKIPLTDSESDAEAVQRAWDFQEGWFAHPTFLTGDYPPRLKEYVETFLTPFTEEQKGQIVNTSDIFAHDAYTSDFIMAPDTGIDACLSNTTHDLYPACYNTTKVYSNGYWAIGPASDPGSPWLNKATDWVPAFLRYMQDTWKPRDGIAIAEFGISEPYESLRSSLASILLDPVRSSYYRDYLSAILIALSEGVNVVGTLAWSIYDNLEWSQGYSVKFGIQYVNLTTQERYFKASAFEYVNMFNIYQEK
ncbi:glycoside hydrolase family 1 protein [Zopfia rhizophila CBS 207.26]|uniref:Glycoside hydrolase family 1 protein n=1 Tax=Zopfia rhizophila CBS 207.26 TaxID=1314779 RepID=A0A6A6DY22_9PEZI|nr:glycoside hydrolase family 1 protein [Zopfia rhizophila CBS 207.26]